MASRRVKTRSSKKGTRHRESSAQTSSRLNRRNAILPAIPPINRRSSQQLASTERAFKVLSRMRAGLSFRSATKEVGIDTRTARRYLRNAITVAPGSRRLRAAKSDRLPARMLFPAAKGDEYVTVRGSKIRSQLGHFYSERGKVLGILADPKSTPLDKERVLQIFREHWHGKKIAGRRVHIDLEELARAGMLSVVEGIYQVGKRGRQ